jgi:hypothetical protein
MIRMLGAIVDASERARQLAGMLETCLAEAPKPEARSPKPSGAVSEAIKGILLRLLSSHLQ